MSKLGILIIHGPRHHGWPEMPIALQSILTATGRFDVEVNTSPALEAPEEEWQAWRPRFADFEAVVQLSEGRYWSDTLQSDFDDYVKGGGGALVLHSSLAAFEGWPAYQDIVGISHPYRAWMRISRGTRITIDDATGEVVRRPPDHGIGPGHGTKHVFPVKTRQPNHSINSGIPDVWLHGEDELWHVMRGPAENIEILASAYSSPEEHGTGLHEPMLWTVKYGEGRTVVSVLGHGPEPIHCVGHQTLLARGVEWAASGAVTIPVPNDFPDEKTTSIVEPDRVVWS